MTFESFTTSAARGADRRSKWRRLRLQRALMFSCGLAALSSQALAQTAASQSLAAAGTALPDGLEEIVVTASKVAESLIKAPIAVTVLTPKDLQDAGVVSIADLTSTAPDLQVRNVGSANAIQITIRGITNTDFNQSGNPAIATYVDGIYVGHTEGLTGAIYDIAQVEVLRGPQGTLYGRNSTGGNLNISTANPENKFDAYTDLSFGNYGDLLTHGMINIPVTDDLAIRAAFVTHRSDGFYNTEGTTARNYGAADDYGGRLTALWTPGSFSWRLSVDDFVGNGTPGLEIVTGTNGKPVDGLPVYDRPVPGFPEPIQNTSNLYIRSRMNYAFNDVLSVSYLAGYADLHETIQDTVSNGAFAIYRPRQNQNYWNEVDVDFNFARFHNIAGASDFHMLNRNFDMQNYDAIGITEGVAERENHVRTSAWGIFDQGTFDITDTLRLVGGVRYSSEDQNNDGEIDGVCPAALYAGVPLNQIPRTFKGPGCAILPVFPSSGTWSDITWKGGLEYDVASQTSSYFTVSTGFKAGGTNAGGGVTAANATFKPEKDINYELGLKSRLLDHRLSLNAAIFYTTYTDIQVTQIVNQTSVTTNAAAARIYGVELEAQMLLTPQDHLSGFANYLHATYTNYTDAVNSLTGAIVPSLDGNYLQDSPQYSLRAQYAHDFVLPNGTMLTPMAAVYWQSFNYLSPFNQAVDRVAAYSKTDLNLTYTDPSRHWSVVAYVDNLEDHAVRTNEISAFGEVFSDYAPPRTFGVRGSYKY
jgi:iron complex outermembrane recepter protein